MSTNVSITVAHGGGIGPKITLGRLHITQAAGARIGLETMKIGERVTSLETPKLAGCTLSQGL
jgi:hypothetical protein